MTESVSHPLHYGGDTAYEHVKVAEAWGLRRNAFLYIATKYLCRAGKKPDDPAEQDLRKAVWYLRRELDCCVRANWQNNSEGLENPDISTFLGLKVLPGDVILAWGLDANLGAALWDLCYYYWSNQGSDPGGYLIDAISRIEAAAARMGSKS